ncbi:MAG: ZIP family metal transporter, partial [Flavobacteriaceae bacterium]|nr:ZIP family metal transporter [Flavobacteriaceae bacterium]
AVLIGVFVVLIVKPKSKTVQLFLSFSGAYLLSITVLHLIPEVFEEQQANIGLYILIGILLQTILEFFSKGAEHGHVHIHGELRRVPWLLLISLGLHAFVEGIPLHGNESNDLLWGIVIHKIPVTLVLAAFLLHTRLSRITIFTILIVFALMSPLGAVIPEYFQFFQKYHTEITAVIIGVFLHIATAILFESSQNHQFNIKKFLVVLIGFGVAYVSTIIGH